MGYLNVTNDYGQTKTVRDISGIFPFRDACMVYVNTTTLFFAGGYSESDPSQVKGKSKRHRLTQIDNDSSDDTDAKTVPVCLLSSAQNSLL